jgi:hypothetical protein
MSGWTVTLSQMSKCLLWHDKAEVYKSLNKLDDRSPNILAFYQRLTYVILS